MKNLSSTDISHFGDIIAIPFFLLSTVYFYRKKNKNKVEYILLLFSISGLILDIYFTYIFLR